MKITPLLLSLAAAAVFPCAMAQPFNTAAAPTLYATPEATNGEHSGSPALSRLYVGWDYSFGINAGDTVHVYANVFFTGANPLSYVRYVHYTVDGGPRQVVFDNPGAGWGGWTIEVGEWRVFPIAIVTTPGTHTIRVYATNGYNTSQGGSPIVYTPECASAAITYFAMGPTGFKVNGVDLNQIFEPYHGGVKAASTGKTVGGTDLNEYFEPVSSSTQRAATTNHLVNGVDLRLIFCPKGKYGM